MQTAGVTADLEQLDYAKSIYSRFNRETGELHQTLKINPNKYTGHDIHRLSEYQSACKDILVELNPTDWRLTRFDFAFDYDQPNVYEELFKINLFAAVLLGNCFKIKNTYYSQDIMTLADLTVRVQDRQIQTEYYNKRYQEPNGAINARFELRTIGNLTDCTEEKIIDDWFAKRFENSLTEKNISESLHRLNLNLFEKYVSDMATAPKTNISRFLHQYRNRIFCVAQLAELYRMFRAQGLTTKYNNPTKSANNAFYNERWETIEPSVVREYISSLYQSAVDYLSA